jgi:CelD/BcsL family acetyltransferase involved in cellulose biosynthesis
MLGAMTADSLSGSRPADFPAAVELLRGPDALRALAPEWQRLAGAAAEPMQTPQWALHAADSFHRDAELLTIAIRQGAELAAVMTLVETRRAGVRWLAIPGAAALGEPWRPLTANASARGSLCDALLALRRPLALPRIDDAAFIAQLREAAKGRCITVAMPGGTSLVTDLDGDPEAHLQRCSAARRKALRRNRRQLEQAGAVGFECQRPTPEDVEPALREAFAVEARSWKGAAGSAVLARPDMWHFFREYGLACAASGRLQIRRLTVDGRVAAVQVATIEGGRCFDLKIGYDPAFGSCSPGLLLTCQALADGARDGLRAHEFLGLAEEWQRAFATRERRFESLVIYPLNAPGLAAFAFDAAGALLRRVRRALGTTSCVA